MGEESSRACGQKPCLVWGGVAGRSKWGEQGGAGRPEGWEVTAGAGRWWGAGFQCCLPCSLVLSAELKAREKEASLQSTLDLTVEGEVRPVGCGVGPGVHSEPPQP